jgi:PhzF family phenazine biosynthesis protein
LPRWLDDPTLQAIAGENNLAETAFLVRTGNDYELRWFTPMVEVDLCGHATLASAHAIFERLEPGRTEVSFRTRKSGILKVKQIGDRLVMDFPVRKFEPVSTYPDAVTAALAGPKPIEVLFARDYIAVLGSESEVRTLKPDLAAVQKLPGHGLVVTARGSEYDFVSRYFAPQVGIPEDPVTGGAHCALTPFWANRLGKTELRAFQASARGGELGCELRGERVGLLGRAVLYLEGHIDI